MLRFFAALAASFLALEADGLASTPSAAASMIIVVGAPGEEEFGKQFREWAAKWEQAASKAGAKTTTLGLTEDRTDAAPEDRDSLKAALDSEPKEGPAGRATELWIVLIGHGTFDGREAKFNLRGTDVSGTELGEWLKPFRRPLAVINTSSASAPFLKALSAPERVVITATRSGHEQNFARYGAYLAEAIIDPKADLDKDGQVSLLEAFLMAARRTAEFYEVEGRLATEHALLDDNGDGLGTPSDFFRGIRAVKRAQEGAALDGLRAHQWHLLRNDAESKMPADVRSNRDRLEREIATLRDSKEKLQEDEYYQKLEKLLLEMSNLYENLEGTSSKPAPR